MDDAYACACESLCNIVVSDSELHPNNGRLQGEKCIQVLGDVFGASKHIHDVDVPNGRKIANHGQTQYLRHLWVVGRYRDNLDILFTQVLRHVVGGLRRSALRFDPEYRNTSCCACNLDNRVVVGDEFCLPVHGSTLRFFMCARLLPRRTRTLAPVSDTTPMESTEEGRAFLQRRVRGAAAFGAWVGLGFLIYRTIMAFVANHMQEFTHPSFLSHATGMLCLAFTWAVCRTGKRSASVIRHSETFGFLGTAVAYSAMTLHITPYEMPHYIVLLSLQGVFVARAIYVPSTARRALTLTIAAGIPVLIVTYLMYRNHDFTYTDDPYLTGRPSDSVALTIVGFATAFWTVCVVLCWGASKVIYGLRKNVRDAKRLGQYELLEKIGEGGMGAVYRARHAMLRRPTAVKLLPLEKAGEKSIKRFEREVQETARLTHPNTIRIFDYGRTPDGVFYYVMELLEGATLEDIVAVDGPQPAARVAYVLEQACRALGEAHDAGLVHRDIKPSNIMVVERGGEHDVAKVLDFGV